MTIFSKVLRKVYTVKMWLMEEVFPSYNAFTFIGTVVLCVFSFYLFKWITGDSNANLSDINNKHSWSPIKINSKSWYCSICELLLINDIGVYCDCCGICADSECIKKANTDLQCKLITTNSEEHTHHWVKGNLPLDATCSVCYQDCSMEPGLIDFRCCWCQKTVHTSCLPHIEKKCDLGPHRPFIIPPWCVQVAKRRRVNRHILLKEIRDPAWKTWTPLIVITNKKAGNGDGALVLSEFRKHLNPIQVVDLSERKPISALQLCIFTAPKQLTVLVGGGDGTISWVLSTAHKLGLDPEPALAVIPLGTGNDLSRVIGWGAQNSSDLNVDQILRDIKRSSKSYLDRWKVEVLMPRHLGLRIPTNTNYLYNYLSIGVDALVALNFHKTRESPFYLFGSRFFNKLLYFTFGTQQAVTSDCKNLEQRITLYLDGSEIELPELESVVILNIASWGAGVNLWSLANDNPRPNNSHRDGLLEVVGIFSSFHIAQMQMGLSAPLKLGQAKVVELVLKQKTPVQIDGEPWEQTPSTIRITYENQCPVLLRKEGTEQF